LGVGICACPLRNPMPGGRENQGPHPNADFSAMRDDLCLLKKEIPPARKHKNPGI
jgi:hypothetical protein